MNIFKSFCFSLAKNQAGADPKKSALAPAQILNRLRLQQKKPQSVVLNTFSPLFLRP